MTTKVTLELERIRAANGGVLRPRDVVAFARNKKTALHGRFCWDNRLAGERYRLEQARDVIRAEVVVLDPGDGTMRNMRAYVSLLSDRGGDSYRSTANVLSVRAMRETLVQQALDELRAWGARYHELRELADVYAAIERATKRTA